MSTLLAPWSRCEVVWIPSGQRPWPSSTDVHQGDWILLRGGSSVPSYMVGTWARVEQVFPRRILVRPYVNIRPRKINRRDIAEIRRPARMPSHEESQSSHPAAFITDSTMGGHSDNFTMVHYSDTTVEPILVGVSEIAEQAGVKPPTVLCWLKRHKEFPRPIAHLKCGRIWKWGPVSEWLVQTGRLNQGEQ